MKFFRLERSGIDVAPLLAEVEANRAAWDADTNRQDRITVQRHTQAIILRGPVRRTDLPVNENQESTTTAISCAFPHALAFMERFAAHHRSVLARAAFVRLRSRSQVYRHIDFGSYYLIRNRYHAILYSAGTAC